MSDYGKHKNEGPLLTYIVCALIAGALGGYLNDAYPDTFGAIILIVVVASFAIFTFVAAFRLLCIVIETMLK